MISKGCCPADPCGRLKNGAPTVSVFIPGACKCYSILGAVFAAVIKLWLLRWGDYPDLSPNDYPQTPNKCHHKHPYKKGRGRFLWQKRRRREDRQRLAWCVHKPKTANNPYKLEVAGDRLSPGLLEETHAFWHPDLGPVLLTAMSNVWCWETLSGCFKPPSVGRFLAATTGN